MVRFNETADEDILEEHKDKFSQIWLKDGNHKGLKSGGHIGKPKRHNQVLIVSLVRTKGCLFNVFICHSNLVIT